MLQSQLQAHKGEDQADCHITFIYAASANQVALGNSGRTSIDQTTMLDPNGQLSSFTQLGIYNRWIASIPVLLLSIASSISGHRSSFSKSKADCFRNLLQFGETNMGITSFFKASENSEFFLQRQHTTYTILVDVVHKHAEICDSLII